MEPNNSDSVIVIAFRAPFCNRGLHGAIAIEKRQH